MTGTVVVVCGPFVSVAEIVSYPNVYLQRTGVARYLSFSHMRMMAWREPPSVFRVSYSRILSPSQRKTLGR